MRISHEVVSKEDWLAARKELLAKEKEFSRLRDELSRPTPAASMGASREGLRLRGPRREGNSC